MLVAILVTVVAAVVSVVSVVALVAVRVSCYLKMLFVLRLLCFVFRLKVETE